MKIQYLEIVTREVDAVRTAYGYLQGGNDHGPWRS